MHKSKIVFVTLGQPLKPWKLFEYEQKKGFYGNRETFLHEIGRWLMNILWFIDSRLPIFNYLVIVTLGQQNENHAC